MKCSVCNTIIEANYCENCGQKYASKKLTIRSLITDVFSSLTDVEKNVFLNVYHIIIFPKKVIEGYWSGFRGYYYSPGKMLFYFVTIAGISSLLLGNTLFGLTLSAENVISSEVLFVILYFPILTLSSFICYRKRKRTFVEHATATIYLISSFGIIILLLENLFIFLGLSTQQDGYWSIILTTSIIVWNALLYSKIKNPLRIFLNVVLEFIILILIVSLLIGLTYLLGAASINLG